MIHNKLSHRVVFLILFCMIFSMLLFSGAKVSAKTKETSKVTEITEKEKTKASAKNKAKNKKKTVVKKGSIIFPKASKTNNHRLKIVQYALKFVGNPYRYGGTSLTKGTDCSGFTMKIYEYFGYKIPHGSRSQARVGRKVSLKKLLPGDLVFYKHGGSIGHVAMYIGGGRVVHAKSRKTGIKTSKVNYNKPCSARRIIK